MQNQLASLFYKNLRSKPQASLFSLSSAIGHGVAWLQSHVSAFTARRHVDKERLLTQAQALMLTRKPARGMALRAIHHAHTRPRIQPAFPTGADFDWKQTPAEEIASPFPGNLRALDLDKCLFPEPAPFPCHLGFREGHSGIWWHTPTSSCQRNP